MDVPGSTLVEPPLGLAQTHEAKPLDNCRLPAAGAVFYRDPTGTLYEVSWTTAAYLDITTITKQPYVWGEDPQLPAAPPVRAGALWRRGLITVQRQLLAGHPSGYVIVSEGANQYIGDYQDSFPCGPQPLDCFCYHLDSAVADDVSALITAGARWTDPDNPTGVAVTWGAGFAWIDAWNR